MERWRIQLLGDLAIRPSGSSEGGEVLVRFRWQKVGSLLARLAWRPGERVSREVLIALLWPDETIEKGRENLRAALASLRRQLEPPDVPAGTVLVTRGRSHLSLNPDAVETDVALFETAFRQGRYADALTLYRGPLLPDLYDDWVLDERERLAGMANRARSQAEESLSPASDPYPPTPDTPAADSPDIRLPFRLTRFHGRKNEIAELTRMLRRERLVTVTGAGGAGKTRFAIETAETLAPDYRSICFVPLADLTTSNALAGHIANQLEIEATPRIESLDALATALNGQNAPILLALDNFEHLTGDEGASLFVRNLLERVPALTCLVTSRHRLGVQGEREFPLLPLAVPPVTASPEQLLAYPAVSLFVDRAQSVRPDFQLTPRNAETVARLVEHLEGIPLALELAASWMKSFSASRILEDISRRSVLVSRGKQPLPARQASLRATLDHSLFLLTPEMRRLLLGLSVFRGGCTPDAAAEICEEPNAAVLLTQLRERSLLYSEEVAGEVRFRMLEVLREHTSEQLDEEKNLALARRHLAWYRQLLETGRLNLHGIEQGYWLDRFEVERPNILTAIHFCLQYEGWEDSETAAESGLRMVGILGRFWLYRGYFQEADRLLEACLSRYGEGRESADVGQCLLWRGSFARVTGDLQRAYEFSQKSLSVYHSVNAEAGIASALGSLGSVDWAAGEHVSAQKRFEECIEKFRALGNRQEVGGHLINLGAVMMEQGLYDEAVAAYEESVEIGRDLGDYRMTAMALQNLGSLFGWIMDNEKALKYLLESVGAFRKSGDVVGTRLALGNCALAYVHLNRLVDAQETLLECFSLSLSSNEVKNDLHFTEVVARYALLIGDFISAVVLLASARRAREAKGLLGTVEFRRSLLKIEEEARMRLREKEYKKAVQEGDSLSWERVKDRARDVLKQPIPQ